MNTGKYVPTCIYTQVEDNKDSPRCWLVNAQQEMNTELVMC